MGHMWNIVNNGNLVLSEVRQISCEQKRISRSPVEWNIIRHQRNASKSLQIELVRRILWKIRGWEPSEERLGVLAEAWRVHGGVWDTLGDCRGWESEALLHAGVCKVSPECKRRERFEVLSDTCRVYGREQDRLGHCRGWESEALLHVCVLEVAREFKGDNIWHYLSCPFPLSVQSPRLKRWTGIPPPA